MAKVEELTEEGKKGAEEAVGAQGYSLQRIVNLPSKGGRFSFSLTHQILDSSRYLTLLFKKGANPRYLIKERNPETLVLAFCPQLGEQLFSIFQSRIKNSSLEISAQSEKSNLLQTQNPKIKQILISPSRNLMIIHLASIGLGDSFFRVSMEISTLAEYITRLRTKSLLKAKHFRPQNNTFINNNLNNLSIEKTLGCNTPIKGKHIPNKSLLKSKHFCPSQKNNALLNNDLNQRPIEKSLDCNSLNKDVGSNAINEKEKEKEKEKGKGNKDNSSDSLLTLPEELPLYMQTIELDGAKFIQSKNSFIRERIQNLKKQSEVGNQDRTQNDQRQANTDKDRGLIPEVAKFLQEKVLQWDQTYFNLSDILIREFIHESLRCYQERLILYYDQRPITLPNSGYIFLEKNPENSLNTEMNGDKIRLIVPVAPCIGTNNKLFPDSSFTRYIVLEAHEARLNPTKAKIDVHDLFFRALMSTPVEAWHESELQTKFDNSQWQAVAKALAPLMHTAEMGILDVQMAFEKADLLRPALEKSTVFFGLEPDQQTRLLSAALSSRKITGMLTEERLKRIKENTSETYPHRHKVSIILALVLSGLVETGATLIGQWPTIDSLLKISDPPHSPWVHAFNLHSVVGESILIPAYCFFFFFGVVYGIGTLCNHSKTGQIAKAMEEAKVPSPS